ncbi:MAG: hypothetical protein ACRDYU_13550 [Actinomycetes bacterium]
MALRAGGIIRAEDIRGFSACQLVETIELDADESSFVNFTDIPQDGANLWLIGRVACTVTGFLDVGMRFNADAGATQYSGFSKRLLADNTTAANWAQSASMRIATVGDTRRGVMEIMIPRYSATAQKSAYGHGLAVDGVGSAGAMLTYSAGGAWEGSDPISQVGIDVFTGSWAASSQFSLYMLF